MKIAEFVEATPDRFVGMGGVALQHPDPGLRDDPDLRWKPATTFHPPLQIAAYEDLIGAPVL